VVEELSVEELISRVQQVAIDLLTTGHTPEDLEKCESYRELQQSADDRLRLLRAGSQQISVTPNKERG
jgi:hypothetical protein